MQPPKVIKKKIKLPKVIENEVPVNVESNQKPEEQNKYYMRCTAQVSLVCKPVFASLSKNLFIVCGQNINVYNSHTGVLTGILEGHRSEIVSICKNKEDCLVSCDKQLNVRIWSIKDVKTLALKKPKIHSKSVCVFTDGFNSSFVVGFNLKRSMDLYLYRSLGANPVFLTNNILSQSTAVCTSKTSLTVAALKSNHLVIIKWDDGAEKLIVRSYASRLQLVCVAYNSQKDPAEDVVAVGNSIGAIVLYYGLSNEEPTKVTLHWHTLPVCDLQFTNEGKEAELLSGGSENVTVCWRYKETSKQFLPRLKAPIKFIAVNDVGSLAVLIHEDKGVTLLDQVNFKVLGLVQSIASHIPSMGIPAMPIGLSFNPRNRTLLFNGRSGHLQAFDPYTSKLMYNIDITMTNFLSKERNQELPNPEVVLATYSTDGVWLITAEMCHLNKKLTETFLKFWQFKDEEQDWEMNSVILMPHDDVLTSISIDPTDSGMCVTTSMDGTFKIWNLRCQPAIGMQTKDRTFWMSSVHKNYRHMKPLESSFSPDGSLLAVAFESVVTLWTPDDQCKLCALLGKAFLTEDIRNVLFSRGECEGSSLITRTDNFLTSWDLLSCTIRWTVNISSSCISVEPTSGVMVVFSKDEKMYFFEPRSSKPLEVIPNRKYKKVTAAVFVPSANELEWGSDFPWNTNSSLYFLDSDQNLINLTYKDELESKIMKSISKILTEEKVEKSLYKSLLASSKHITKPQLGDGEVLMYNKKYMIQQLQGIQVHNMESLDCLGHHLDSILPDIKSTDATTNDSLSYSTIKDSELRSEKTIKKDPICLEKSILALSKLNFDKMACKKKKVL